MAKSRKRRRSNARGRKGCAPGCIGRKGRLKKGCKWRKGRRKCAVRGRR